MVKTESIITASDRASLFSLEWKPDGDLKGAVILVHGLGEHCGRYEYVAQKLTASGYTLVGFDLRGHGKSPGKRGHTYFEVVKDDISIVKETVTKRYPGTKQWIYGHSMGGNLVLNYLLTRKPQFTGAIVTSPGLKTGVPLSPLKKAFAKIASRILPAYTIPNGLDLQNLSRDPDVIARYQADPLVHPYISARLGNDLLTSGEMIVEQAANFGDVPLLLMQGTADHIVNPDVTQKFAESYTGKINYIPWKGFYHELHNEPEKELVLDTIIQWMERIG
ncbi:MAG TPA: lysophospholipase [Anaerolineaceae bacterium]